MDYEVGISWSWIFLLVLLIVLYTAFVMFVLPFGVIKNVLISSTIRVSQVRLTAETERAQLIFHPLWNVLITLRYITVRVILNTYHLAVISLLNIAEHWSTLLVGRQEGHPVYKKLGFGLLMVTIWLELCTL